MLGKLVVGGKGRILVLVLGQLVVWPVLVEKEGF